MTSADMDALKFQIATREGLRLKPYTDTTGHLTIGYGRNLSDIGITPAEADLMLEHDIASAIGYLTTRYPWFDRLDTVRQRVLIDMCFNLGPEGLGGFPRFLDAVRAGFYDDAAAEMLASKWARQVGQRSTRLATMMRTGQA